MGNLCACIGVVTCQSLSHKHVAESNKVTRNGRYGRDDKWEKPRSTVSWKALSILKTFNKHSFCARHAESFVARCISGDIRHPEQTSLIL